MTFSEYSTKYETTILPLKTPATVAAFSSHLKALRVAFGNHELSELRNGVVQEFFTARAKTHSPKSVKNLWGTFRVVLGQAQQDEILDKIPKIVLPKVRRAEQAWFTPEQMREIVRNSLPHDQALFLTAAETGMRIGELIALRVFEISENSIKIQHSLYRGKLQQPKTDSSVRTISISRKLTEVLAKHNRKRVPAEFVFCISETNASSRLHRVLDGVGIPKCGFHAFRHGARALWSLVGMPDAIAEMRMGHTPKGIAGTYHHNIQFADKPWVEKISKLLF